MPTSTKVTAVATVSAAAVARSSFVLLRSACSLLLGVDIGALILREPTVVFSRGSARANVVVDRSLGGLGTRVDGPGWLRPFRIGWPRPLQRHRRGLLQLPRERAARPDLWSGARCCRLSGLLGDRGRATGAGGARDGAGPRGARPGVRGKRARVRRGHRSADVGDR